MKTNDANMLRNGLTINRIGKGHSGTLQDYAKSIDWNNYRMVLPIPKYEVDANSEIRAQQNPGW